MASSSRMETIKEEDWEDDEEPPRRVVNRDRDGSANAFQNLKQVIAAAKPYPPHILNARVFGTSMKNVPHLITTEDLIRKIKQDFPETFAHQDLICTKYSDNENSNGKRLTIAVVSGARGELRDLQRRSFLKSLDFEGTPFNYVFLPDFGVPRSNSGKRLNPLNGTAFHVIREREGPQQRLGIKLFTDKFRKSIPEVILNRLGPSTLFFEHSSFYIKDLPEEGLYRIQGGNKRGRRRIDSASELEAIQLIRKLNLTNINGETLVFENQNGKVESSCSDKMGLGIDGSMLPFDEFTHTIPLSWIDPAIKNNAFIASFFSTCFRCEEQYVLMATSVNLEYLMAKCGCGGPCLSYDQWNRQLVPFDSPFHHPGEVQTRMAYNLKNDTQEHLIAFSYLPKLSISYPSVYMMCNVLLPVLEEEWRAIRDESHSNFCSAMVVKFENLGRLDGEHDRRFIHVVVTQNKFWLLYKSPGYKNVTITCNVKITWKDAVFQTTVNGLLCKAEKLEQSQLSLIYEVSWKRIYEMTEMMVVLTPNADKCEYIFCRKYLTTLPINFSHESNGSNRLSKLFLTNTSKKSKFGFTKRPSEKADFSSKINEVIGTLNEQQNSAFEQSLSDNHVISLIQGPPGTGKSYLISAVALGLATTRSGAVLCLAGSNIACNVMYNRISKLSESYGINMKVCRVFSRGREMFLRRQQTDHENSLEDSKTGKPMRALHNLVASEDKYLQGNRTLWAIQRLFESGEEYRMSQEQRNVFYNHVTEFEKKILEKEKIIVMTIGCLAAYRLGRKDEEGTLKNLKINSILVDEAGILSKLNLLPLETLKPTKIILIGDHLQLPPHVHSPSASDAGLNRSMMELLVQDRHDLEIPMTMLRIQFRAHKDLRSFTSHVTYDDKLLDVPGLASRKEVLQTTFFDAFPRFKENRIMVKNHNGRDKDSDKSKANVSEAKIVLDTVKDFINGKYMTQKDIVILTPYEAQKSLITKMLEKEHFENVPCKNVDEFQGNEATCVIISFTRSNAESNLGFLMIANRVNVCISRARELMVLCINLRMLKPWKDSNSHLGRMYRFLKNPKILTTVEVAPEERVEYNKHHTRNY